ncbi:kinase-like domain-containing protein [Jimgerdemannia flammicorona]|uniref:Kinase-like domain-containing protein n=1 Tax=Jimgerdemannia flammicorona TaxID=994334 RepID=A0A433DNM9_9FUNG|nr:kinase-like domain-containing protein [Jimgerdemannia flammicorona]
MEYFPGTINMEFTSEKPSCIIIYRPRLQKRKKGSQATTAEFIPSINTTNTTTSSLKPSSKTFIKHMSAFAPMSVPKLDHWVDGVPTYYSNPEDFYDGLSAEIPTWTSELGDVYYCREAAGARQTVVIRKYLTNEQNYVPNNFGISTELVENEIFTMAKCALHPNILRLHSIYIYNGYVFLVTPFCDGGTLYQHCLDNCVALPQMVFILKRLVSGLSEIHKHGYIHRDIKSQNVFLGKDNAVMLGGFGVSSLTPTVDSSVEKAGVTLFWAPEICECKLIDLKVDIWALGIVVLEMLNHGKAPYEDDNLEDEEIKRKIIEQGRPCYPENLDSQLADFIDQCLERDPEHRSSASDLLKHSLFSAYAEEPLFPPRPRQQPSSQSETMTAHTSELPSPHGEASTGNTSSTLSPTALSDINGMPGVFNESLTREASPPSSTDHSSAKIWLKSADYAFNVSSQEQIGEFAVVTYS